MSDVAVRLAGVSELLRIASVNVNGIRAAVRKGMIEWLDATEVDVLALQEVRADADQLAHALPGWEIVADESTGKPASVVARQLPIASKFSSAKPKGSIGA